MPGFRKPMIWISGDQIPGFQRTKYPDSGDQIPGFQDTGYPDFQKPDTRISKASAYNAQNA